MGYGSKFYFSRFLAFGIVIRAKFCVLSTDFSCPVYNFVRPHMGLDGRTPAEAAGIKIVGRDKWMTIIGNAGMYRLAEERRTTNVPAA